MATSSLSRASEEAPAAIPGRGHANPRVMNEDRAARYHRLKRRAGVVSLVWTVVILVGVLWTGLSVGLRAAAKAWASFAPRTWTDAIAVVFYVIGLSLIAEIGSLPLPFYGGLVLRRPSALALPRRRGPRQHHGTS